MTTTTGGDDPITWRAPIEADWLGREPECRLTARRLLLRDAATGAHAALAPNDITTVERHGRRLRLRTTHGRWSDFAGVAFDGWYEIALLDDASAAELAARLGRAIAASGPRPRWRRPGAPLAEEENVVVALGRVAGRLAGRGR